MFMDDHKANRWVACWSFSCTTHKKEMSFWTPLWLEMKHEFFTTLLNTSNSHCNGTIHIPPEPKNSKLQFQWNNHGVHFLGQKRHSPGTAINAAAYCDTLTQLRQVNQNKRRGMLSRGVCLFRDNAWPHSTLVTTVLLGKFKWDILDHPLYSWTSCPAISTCFFT